jgi:RpiR family carbohydrate utilization transcriptional regulator
MVVSCLKVIHDYYKSLSYSEKLIADYTFDNAASLINLSIQELAEILGIAPSTIIAFVKKIGFTGYSQFKITLASEVLNPTHKQWNTATIDNNDNLYISIAKSNIRALEESFDMMDFNNIQAAASIISVANKIVLFGIGSSSMLAHEAYDLFLRLGLNCSINDDIHHQMLAAALLQKGDVGVLLSQSGVNNDIIQIVETINKNDAKTIGICNYSKTPFYKIVDVGLAPFSSVANFHPKHYVFKIPILCIIETLYYALANNLNNVEKMIEKSKNIVEDTSI